MMVVVVSVCCVRVVVVKVGDVGCFVVGGVGGRCHMTSLSEVYSMFCD